MTKSVLFVGGVPGTKMASLAVGFLVLATIPIDSFAVPSMARQMGMQCASCHTVFPELTPFGRQFKLRGYSMSIPKNADETPFDKIPVSTLLQISRTRSQDVGPADTADENFPQDRKNIIQAAGIYYGGKIGENSGALVQYSYDGYERRWGMEMFDARYAGNSDAAGGVVYGFTLNNNPTVSDVYNSTPAWGFPHVESGAMMPPGPVVDMRLASQSAGFGVYGLWSDILYTELAVYRTAKSGLLRPLGAGVPTEEVLKGSAPYWRVALTCSLIAVPPEWK